jgi:hypothetical protein
MPVEHLTVRGQAAVEGGAVPGGEPGAGIARQVLARNVGLAGDLIRPSDEVAAAALRHRLALLDDAGARGDAVFRIDGAAAARGDLRRGAVGGGERGRDDGGDPQRRRNADRRARRLIGG